MSQIQEEKVRSSRVTILDVAAEAGVSKSTVSRILDDRFQRSNSETARRVREVAARLGYMRDVSAASLRRGSTLTIGLVVPRLTDTVMAMLHEALATAAARSGRIVIVATSGDDPIGERAAAETLIQRGVDGLVLSSARLDDSFPGELSARGIPHVLALRTDGHSRSAIGDDELGGYLATRHLLDLGHRRIGVIAGPDYASSSQGRVKGYRAALVEAGLGVCDELIVASSFGIESGAVAAAQLLSLSDRPTGIFAVNDNAAIGALSALHRSGLSVPEDVSLVGYNDIPIVSRLPVPMTSVRVPFEQIAATALELLDMESTPADPIRKSTPSLIPRATTVPLKTRV